MRRIEIRRLFQSLEPRYIDLEFFGAPGTNRRPAISTMQQMLDTNTTVMEEET